MKGWLYLSTLFAGCIIYGRMCTLNSTASCHVAPLSQRTTAFQLGPKCKLHCGVTLHLHLIKANYFIVFPSVYYACFYLFPPA